MKCTYSKDKDGTWCIKIYFKRMTKPGREQAHKKLDQGIEYILDCERIRKEVNSILSKQGIHLNTYLKEKGER